MPMSGGDTSACDVQPRVHVMFPPPLVVSEGYMSHVFPLAPTPLIINKHNTFYCMF